MQGEQEAFLICPYCFQSISMVLELYYGNQEYIEDCQVCCSPIEVCYQINGEQAEITTVKKAE